MACNTLHMFKDYSLINFDQCVSETHGENQDNDPMCHLQKFPGTLCNAFLPPHFLPPGSCGFTFCPFCRQGPLSESYVNGIIQPPIPVVSKNRSREPLSLVLALIGRKLGCFSEASVCLAVTFDHILQYQT